MPKSNAERQKAFREKRKATAPPDKITNRFPTTSVPAIEGRVVANPTTIDEMLWRIKALEQRVQDLEDGRAPEPVSRETPRDALAGLRAQIAAVPSTRDTPPVPMPTFQGRAPRTCCQTFPGFAHTDDCREVG